MSSGNVTYVGTDTNTQGDWHGVYGFDGYLVCENSSSYPSYATLSASGYSDYTWESAPATNLDKYAQTGASASIRIAACYYSPSPFTITVSVSGVVSKKVSIYCMDYNGTVRSFTWTAEDSDGTVLQSGTQNTYGQVWLIFEMVGTIVFRFTCTAGGNAVVSCVMFDPIDYITKGMTTWVRSDYGLMNSSGGICSNGDTVSTWLDYSGNSNNWSLRRGSPLAVYNNINGRPAIRQTSSDEMYTTFNFPYPCTVIYIARMDSGSNARILSAINNNWLLGWWSGGQQNGYFDGWVALTGATNDFLPHVYSVVQTGSLSSFYGNGTLIASNNNGVDPPNGLGTNGGAYSGEGSNSDVAEIVVYPWALTDFQRLKTEQYLYNKWNPSIVPGMSLWLKADVGALNSGATPCADNDTVATWTDQSGNGKDATLATGAPKLRKNILNGLPVVRFDGSSGLSTTLPAPNAPGVAYSAFYVTTVEPGATGSSIASTGNSNYRCFHLQVFGDNSWHRYAGANFIRSDTSVISYTCDTSNNETFWENGVIKSSGNTNTDSDSGNWYVGITNNGVFPLTGDIAEILIYPTALNQFDRQRMEAYLYAKWMQPFEIWS
jgi:hypothetical protein